MSGGRASVSTGATQLLGDLAGYYLGQPAAAPASIAPVTGLTVKSTTTSAQLSWTGSADGRVTGVLVRRAGGASAPSSPTAGTLVSDVAATSTSVSDGPLSPGSTYSYALFAHDGAGHYSAAVTTSVTAVSQGFDPISDPVPPAIPASVASTIEAQVARQVATVNAATPANTPPPPVAATSGGLGLALAGPHDVNSFV